MSARTSYRSVIVGHLRPSGPIMGPAGRTIRPVGPAGQASAKTLSLFSRRGLSCYLVSMATPQERWKALAQARLPPVGDVVERNRAITAEYAGWYLRRHELFKWAGMAAFASHHVGMAFRSAALRAIIPDLERIRHINNLIYADIGWAHLAYETEGIAAIEEALGPKATPRRRSGRPAKSIMLEAFRSIERGRRQIEAGQADAGRKLVWQGNLLLLKHEQFDTVQPEFTKLSREFSY